VTGQRARAAARNLQVKPLSNRIALSPNESYPQHVVTAVVVAHDGAAWLPQLADALAGQTRPVQRVVAVDTGSRDRSGAVLAARFGQGSVFGMDRATGYGAAIARALVHRAANAPVPGDAADRVEWLWLLHDDCEPAPDALEQLLRGVTETGSAAVLGPKVRDWSNREVILEAGITIDTAARRVTGIEPREIDQGQHDGDRDALAVSSAGMLVRREVWEQVGGFDPAMGLFMEDVDFCWRVHAAGYRVRVVTDAVVYHVQASARHRRPVSVGRRPRLLDRRNGLLTLLGNLPLRQLPAVAAGNLLVSLLRITFFLLAKRITAALDEAAAIAAVLGHPLRLHRARRRRRRGRRAAYARVRGDLPPGRSARRLAEFAAATVLRSAQGDAAGAHHASADPGEDDSLLTDNGLARRLLTSPPVLALAALLAVSLVASRSLLGSGPLGGGSLVPAWGGASDLWRVYLQAFHPAGLGSAAAAPPYVAVLALLASLLGGKPWLAVDVLLIGCVPLAGMTAMLAARRVSRSRLVTAWAAISYALLPVSMGIVAGGRLGMAVAFVLLPLIALLAGRVVTAPGPQGSRAAWGAGLLVAVGAAFVPLLWLVAIAACAIAALGARSRVTGTVRRLAVVALTAPVLLLPWTITLAAHPGRLFLEAGLPQPGTPPGGLPARSLLLLSPGGPGLPPYWVTGGLLAVAFAALFSGRRRKLVVAGWGVALAGLLAAIGVSHVVVSPPDGGPVITWTGLPLAIAGLGLLLAATAGADALGRMLAGRRGWRAVAGARGLWAAVVAAAACSAPVLAASAWLGSGGSGLVHPVAAPVVPELVAAADGQARQVRTLVLRSVRGQVSYLLLRGASPGLADADLTPPAGARRALDKVVAALVSPEGGLVMNESRGLAGFDIGFVMVQAPVDPALAGVLDNVAGLRPYSVSAHYDLWQLVTPPSRVSVLEPNGSVVAVPSGPAAVSGAAAPAPGGTLLLAEPAGPWTATLNGRRLDPVPSPAGRWAQAFRLPPGGGRLDVGYSGLPHDLALWFQVLALLLVVALALPGLRVAEAEGAAGAAMGRAGAAPGVPGLPEAVDAAGREGADAGAAGSGRRVAASGRGAGRAGGTGRPRGPGHRAGRAAEASGRDAASLDRRPAGRPAPWRPAAGRPAEPPGGRTPGRDRPGSAGEPAGPQSRAWPYLEGEPGPPAAGGGAGGGPGRTRGADPAGAPAAGAAGHRVPARSPSGMPPPARPGAWPGGRLDADGRGTRAGTWPSPGLPGEPDRGGPGRGAGYQERWDSDDLPGRGGEPGPFRDGRTGGWPPRDDGMPSDGPRRAGRHGRRPQEPDGDVAPERAGDGSAIGARRSVWRRGLTGPGGGEPGRADEEAPW